MYKLSYLSIKKKSVNPYALGWRKGFTDFSIVTYSPHTEILFPVYFVDFINKIIPIFHTVFCYTIIEYTIFFYKFILFTNVYILNFNIKLPVFRNLRIQYPIVEIGIWFSRHHALQDCPLVWKSWIRSDHNASFSSFFIMIQFLSCSEVIVSEKCSEKQIRMITYLHTESHFSLVCDAVDSKWFPWISYSIKGSSRIILISS